LNFYAGVVVRINLTPREYVETLNTCSNGSCTFKEKTSAKFCGECGTIVLPMNFARVGSIGFEQFMEALPKDAYDQCWDEQLYSPECVGNDKEEILLAESSGTFIDEYESIATLGNALEKMERDFRKENDELIDFLEAFFGDNVIIETGIVSYWS